MLPGTVQLKNRGLKATLPRMLILDVFQNAQIRYLSAEDIYRLLLSAQHAVGLSTVYRVLRQLHQADLLKQIHFAAGKAVYALNDGQHHDHLICSICGKVQAFHDAALRQREEEIAHKSGFALVASPRVFHCECINAVCEYRRNNDKVQGISRHD